MDELTHEPQVPTTLTRLSVLDTLFDATGTVDLKVGHRVISIPIQSVDTEMVEVMARQYRPKVPTYRDQIQGQWKTVLNEADPEYQQKIGQYNIVYANMMAFSGIAIDIIGDDGNVVWSADNKVCNYDATVKATKKMGLVLNHIIALNRAINGLTATIDEVRTSD